MNHPDLIKDPPDGYGNHPGNCKSALHQVQTVVVRHFPAPLPVTWHLAWAPEPPEAALSAQASWVTEAMETV